VARRTNKRSYQTTARDHAIDPRELGLVIAALTDPYGIQDFQLRVSPGCAILLDLVTRWPGPARTCLSDYAMALLDPDELDAPEAVRLALAVERAIDMLAAARIQLREGAA
jgi:hypothetical protein